jgi:hypothetical protein
VAVVASRPTFDDDREAVWRKRSSSSVKATERFVEVSTRSGISELHRRTPLGRAATRPIAARPLRRRDPRRHLHGRDLHPETRIDGPVLLPEGGADRIHQALKLLPPIQRDDNDRLRLRGMALCLSPPLRKKGPAGPSLRRPIGGVRGA